jgi:hypothetical protein
VQSVQLWPRVPQAVSSAPPLHVPVESQHPEQVAAQFPPPVVVPGLQTMMGRVGAAASGPHESPRGHSEVDAQSWIGPIGVAAHGPTWQLVVIAIVPQQTVPAGQFAALVQATPAGAPPPGVPPLELLPVTTASLLDPPPAPVPPLLLNPPPLDVLSSPWGMGPVPPSAPVDAAPSGPGSVASLPPHADARVRTSSTATQRGFIRISRLTTIHRP